jgi:hypothetical protein
MREGMQLFVCQKAFDGGFAALWTAAHTCPGELYVYTSMKDVGMSEEVIDEWRGRVLVDFVRLADLLDLTFPHDHDAIG